jgi:hypothetical protein
MNCVLLSAFVGWCIVCKNMHGVIYIKSPLPRSYISTTGPYPELDKSNHSVPLCFILPHHLRLDLASGFLFLLVFRPQLLMHCSYLPFVLYTLPIFGTPQPYRYHVKRISQWTSCQAQWKFYTALLRSQDRFEFTRNASDSSASSSP